MFQKKNRKEVENRVEKDNPEEEKDGGNLHCESRTNDTCEVFGSNCVWKDGKCSEMK